MDSWIESCKILRFPHCKIKEKKLVSPYVQLTIRFRFLSQLASVSFPMASSTTNSNQCSVKVNDKVEWNLLYSLNLVKDIVQKRLIPKNHIFYICRSSSVWFIVYYVINYDLTIINTIQWRLPLTVIHFLLQQFFHFHHFTFYFYQRHSDYLRTSVMIYCLKEPQGKFKIE